ncbi:MAG TPA: lysylphosphatidylglycerol synthase transmembrane domain-containing protein [Solirubrobacteraceae bacterium]|nr:lysylphosphatidylglycerol synthase transmembrane domain-containing protein [Solirubrobacteraceae bacterium]
MTTDDTDPQPEHGADDPSAGRSHVLRAAERWLRQAGLRLVGYLVAAYLLIRLLPALREALEDLERPSWGWLVAVFALEIVSEMGFVVSWQAVVDPEGRLVREGGPRVDVRVAWAQLGAGMFIPGGSLSSVGAGTWLLHRLGMPLKSIAERQFSLSFLNTAVDALVLIAFGLALAVGLLPGERNPLLTVLPAGVAAVAIVLALLAAARLRRLGSDARESGHPRFAAAVATVGMAVEDTRRLLTHRSGVRSVLGALAYLFCDVLVLFFAFPAIRAPHAPSFGVVVLAYIIGALGGSIPLPAAVGAVGGMVGMFILYGIHRDTAVAAVVLYQAVGLIVPLIGGGIAYLLLRRDFAGSAAAEPSR